MRDKTYNKTCATSEDSGQHAHPSSLIRVYTGGMCLLQYPLYPRGIMKTLATLGRYTGCSESLLHMSYCRFCHALAHLRVLVSATAHVTVSPDHSYTLHYFLSQERLLVSSGLFLYEIISMAPLRQLVTSKCYSQHTHKNYRICLPTIYCP